MTLHIFKRNTRRKKCHPHSVQLIDMKSAFYNAAVDIGFSLVRKIIITIQFLKHTKQYNSI